jgi:phosphopantetheine--protein transferase-like protein
MNCNEKRVNQVFGIGVDILKIQRVLDLTKMKSTALKKIFTQKEIQDALRAERHFEQYLAEVFACKEAVFKALRFSWADGIKWTDIEIVKEEGGKPPTVNLMGKACAIAKSKGINNILLTLSHETDYVVSVCIALNGIMVESAFNQKS